MPPEIPYEMQVKRLPLDLKPKKKEIAEQSADQTDKESKCVFKGALKQLVINFYEHSVGKNAAALAYYLLFSLFPLLIFVTNLVGLLDLDVHSITSGLQQILPVDIIGIIEAYLDYITHTSSHTLLWFSLVFSIWFPLRAAQGLMDDVRRAHRLGTPKKPIAYIFKQLIYTIVFLVVIVLTLLLSITGQRVLIFIGKLLKGSPTNTVGTLLTVWQYLRFLPIALLMVLAIGTLYSVALDKRPAIPAILPGTIFALLGWMIVSIGFSFYIENFAHYSLIYGTLGTVIILLTWLYLTALILIIGAELNAILSDIRAKRKDENR